MEHNPNQGNVLHFRNRGPVEARITVRTRSVSSMNEGMAAVAQAKPEPANTNALGDLAPTNEYGAQAYRLGAADFVNTMLRDIMTENDAYTPHGSAQIDWLMANFFHGVATSVRDWIGVRIGTHSKEYAAADNYADIMADHFSRELEKRGA